MICLLIQIPRGLCLWISPAVFGIFLMERFEAVNGYILPQLSL